MSTAPTLSTPAPTAAERSASMDEPDCQGFAAECQDAVKAYRAQNPTV